MYNLVVNEWIKIFRQIGTYVMLGLVILLVIANGALTLYFNPAPDASPIDWRTELANANAMMEAELSNDEAFITPFYREMLTKEMAINDYRLTHDIAPEHTYTAWQFVMESASFINFAGLFVIIVAAGIVANEFSWGTIKVLLVKPFRRWKFLTAKYVAIILFLIFTLAILFISVIAVGIILFGSGEATSHIHLAYVNGSVVEQSLALHLIKTYLLNAVGVFFLATMAFMISASFRANGLAIGLSIFLLLMGQTVTGLLASKFTWAKYILFANTDLTQYIDGRPMVEGMTMSFSLTMLIIYFVIFQLLAFVFFTKRDVST